MGYTDEQIKFLVDLKLNTLMEWSEIAEEFNEKFGQNKSANAVRKKTNEVIAMLDPKDVESKNLTLQNLRQTHTAKKANSKLRKENKIILDNIIEFDEFVREVEEINKKCPIKLHPTVKLKSKKKTDRTLVAHLSDTHIGIDIKKAVMDNVNEFNVKIASRRFAYFFKTLVQYKADHRDETNLDIVLNGDILSGIIHGIETNMLPMSTQHSAALRIFAQGISFVAQYFKRVRVICTGGNHGRFMHKSNKGRQTEEKWDSFETILYTSLREVFHKHNNIEFIIPPTPYALVEIQGHNVLMTHGDTFLNVGYPGKSINIESITNQINKISTGLNKKIDIIMVGHVHKPTYITLDNGADLVINGTLSGTDEFAQSIGIVSNHPTQQIFESTPDHTVGDMRFVRVDDGDTDESLDQIIQPYEELF